MVNWYFAPSIIMIVMYHQHYTVITSVINVYESGIQLFCNTITYTFQYELWNLVHRFIPCGLGDQNSANVCPCACHKRLKTKGYKLSYSIPPGLLHAWPSCMQWGIWVWTVGHWVVHGSDNMLFQMWMSSIFITNGIPERRSWVTATVVSPIFP